MSTVVGMKAVARELQNAQVRAKAAEAFFALGALLQSLGQSVSNIVSESMMQASQIGAPNMTSGIGYMRGAFAAYYMCNSLTGANNAQYRTALENISQFGPS